MSDFIAIPAALFDEPEYRTAAPAVKVFLISLYAEFSDCERFTIEIPLGIGGNMIYKNVRGLVDSGLIKVVDLQSREGKKPQRIFAFAYPSEQAYA